MQPGILTRVRRHPVKLLVIATALLLLIVVLGRRLVERGDEQRALRNLPEPERHALYERTLENLRTVCARLGNDGLRDYCEDQAKVARQLHECDAGCRELTGRYLRGATR